MVVNLSYQVFSTEAAAAAQDARDCFTLPRKQANVNFSFPQRGVRGSCFRVIQRFQTNVVGTRCVRNEISILSINIASVGTVLYTYLLIEGEDEEKKTGQEFFGATMAWRGRTGTKPFQSHRAVGKLSPYIFLTTSRKVQTLEPLPPSRLPSSDRYDYR